MWNFVASNPILDRRLKYQARKKHITALNNMKGQMTISQPFRPKFLLSKQKSRQLQAQRRGDIHHSNDILIDKMINAQTSVPRQHERMRSMSLSRSYRRKVQRQIDLGNEMIIRKLQEIGSCYPVDRILRQTDNYMYYRNHILNSRTNTYKREEDLNVSYSTRPRSAKR